MKTKEKQTLLIMKPEELTKVLKDAQNALAILMINKPTKNVREGRLLKRKIAIIQTLLRQKEITHE
jgi:ribosomal protein L29